MKKGFISDIQHFCVSDGPGIRTTIFFKGCNLRCAWCHNVECIGMEKQTMRYVIGGKEQLRVCGREMTAEEVLYEIDEDVRFYEQSGGGVTFSGGEALLQSDFLVTVMQPLKARGIHTIIDTAGDVPFTEFEKVIAYTGTFFFDIKAKNAEDYKRYTGGDFENILNNLRALIRRGCDVVVRIPVIPKLNDSEAYMREMCTLLKEIGVSRVDLLPFNRLGSSKYTALGLQYAYKDVKTMQKSDLTGLLNVCKEYFDARIDG